MSSLNFYPPHKRELTQLLVELVAMGILLVASIATFGCVDVALGLGVAYIVPRLFFARLSRGNFKGGVVMTAVGLLLVAWGFHNIYSWTVAGGHLLCDPMLHSDDSVYYQWALHYLDGSVPEPTTKFEGFPMIVLISWRLFGHNIVWPTAINVMLTLFSVAITGLTAGRMLAGRLNVDKRFIAFLAMLVTSLLGFFLSHATQLLKEPTSYFSVALAAYAIARMKEDDAPTRLLDKSTWRDIALFTVAVVLMAASRTSIIYFMIAGVALAWLDNVKMWRYATTLLVIAAIGVCVGIYWSNGFSWEVQKRILTGADGAAEIMQKLYQAHGIYGVIMSDYFGMTVLEKICFLPVTCALQFFIPLPWPTGAETGFWANITRFQGMWYAVVCLYTYYLAAFSWKKGNLGAWALWPLVCAAAIAFATSGTVSRYLLPFEPLFVIVALWTALKLHADWRHGIRHRSFLIWAVVYTAVLTAALAYCFFFTAD